MALVRRHWKLALLNVLLLCLAVAALIYKLGISQQRTVGATTGPTVATSGQLDLPSYSQISSIREELCLTNRDLAAMGCNGSTARALFSALLSWYRQSQPAINQAIQSEVTAQANLRDVIRRIQVGPCDESALSQVSSLRTAVASATTNRQALVGQASDLIQQKLNNGQSTIWRSAKSNQNLPEQYRYTPDLSATESQSLLQLVRGTQFSTGGRSVDDSTIITTARRSAMASAQASVEANLSAVAAAEQEILPTPAAFGSPVRQPQ